MARKKTSTRAKQPAKRKPSARKKAARPTAYPWISEDLRLLAEPLDRLELDPENARTHGQENLAAIVASLREFGQRKPLVANRRNGQIEAGNGTYLAAQELGWSHLAVVWVEDDPSAQTGFSIADNRTSELADWDQVRLAALLEQVQEDSPELADALLLSKLQDATPVKIKALNVKAPPKMSWVLIGIPTVRFGEIAEAIDRLAGVPDLFLEMTANDDER